MWYVILEHEDKNARCEGRANMETSDSNNEDIHLYSRSMFCFHVQRTHHNLHIFVSFDVENNVETLT